MTVSQPSAADVRRLRARLDGLTLRDASRIGRRLRSLRNPVSEATFADLSRQFDAAEALIAARSAAVPAISYPDLPVSALRGELAAAIAANQVVVVAGETGSGKTTQLPKICLELGRGVRGVIGHTQPRRLAARTVAERIAEELKVPMGQAIGYSVRFTDNVSDRTLVKLMTDGSVTGYAVPPGSYTAPPRRGPKYVATLGVWALVLAIGMVILG